MPISSEKQKTFKWLRQESNAQPLSCGCGFKSCCSHLNFKYHTYFKLLDIQTTINFGFTQKRACDMIRIYRKILFFSFLYFALWAGESIQNCIFL